MKSKAKLSFKRMKRLVDEAFRFSKNKAVFSVLIYMLLEIFLVSLSVSPFFVSMLTRENPSTISAVTTLVLYFGTGIVLSMMFYGLNEIMMRLVTKQFVTLGFLFIGFKKDRKRVFFTALINNAIQMLVMAVVGVVGLLLLNKLGETAVGDQNNLYFYMFYALGGLVIYIFKIPLLFAWLELITNDKISSIKAIGKSIAFTFRHFFSFIAFEFYVAWKQICVMVFTRVIQSFTSGTENGVLSFIGLFASAVGFIAEINMLIKMFYGLPVFFYSRTPGKNLGDASVVGDENSAEIQIVPDSVRDYVDDENISVEENSEEDQTE